MRLGCVRCQFWPTIYTYLGPTNASSLGLASQKGVTAMVTETVAAHEIKHKADFATSAVLFVPGSCKYMVLKSSKRDGWACK